MNILILGGSGDLAVRKLLPAVPKSWTVTAYGRRKTTWKKLKRRSKAVCKGSYHSVDLLSYEWDNVQADIVYCALPSELYVNVLTRMPLSGQIVLCEKPVGRSTATAKKILDKLSKLNADVRYIDHYLGKGILDTFYFLHMANPLLRNSWSTKHVEQITVHMRESMTARHRAEYYDQTGVVRDVVQNHALQLIAHTLLTKHTNVSKTRAKLIDNLTVDSCRLGQYQPYHNNQTVATYADIMLSHAQWNKTRFRIIAGKGLDSKYTAVHIKMRQDCPTDVCPVADTIILELYPIPRVRLQMYTGPKTVRAIDVPMNIATTQVTAYKNILTSMPSTQYVVSEQEILAQWNVVNKCLKKRVTKQYKRGEKV